MKILQVINTLSATAGGPTEGAVTQHRELTAMGHIAHMLTLDSPEEHIDGRITPGAVFCVGPRKLRYGYSAGLASWLRANARNYDVLVIHGLWQYHGYCVRRIANSLGVPYVVFFHGMLDPWFKTQYPLKHLKKWLYWLLAEYRVVRDAHFVLFTSAEEMFLARESFWLYKARERLVGYGIRQRQAGASAGELFLQQFPDLRGKRILLFLSRIHPKKGCDLLIRSFSAVAGRDPALHLVFAGPDLVGWGSRLAQLAQDLDVRGRVSFIGMLQGEIKWGAYDAAEIFVLPSHQENFGIAVAEALASRVPVLTTNKINIWREIEGAGAGFIDIDTQAGIDRLLRRWLEMTERERLRMRERAIACFLDLFEIGRVVDKLQRALEQAASTEKTPFSYVSARPRWLAGPAPPPPV